MKDSIRFMPASEEEVINLTDEVFKAFGTDDAKKILDEVSKEANELMKYFEFSDVRNYINNRLFEGDKPKQAAWKAFIRRENNWRYIGRGHE